MRTWTPTTLRPASSDTGSTADSVSGASPRLTSITPAQVAGEPVAVPIASAVTAPDASGAGEAEPPPHATSSTAMIGRSRHMVPADRIAARIPADADAVQPARPPRAGADGGAVVGRVRRHQGRPRHGHRHVSTCVVIRFADRRPGVRDRRARTAAARHHPCSAAADHLRRCARRRRLPADAQRGRAADDRRRDQPDHRLLPRADAADRPDDGPRAADADTAGRHRAGVRGHRRRGDLGARAEPRAGSSWPVPCGCSPPPWRGPSTRSS